MNPYAELLKEARRKRNMAIDKARADYRRAVLEIDRMGRKLNGTGGTIRYTALLRGDGSDFASMTSIKAAEVILRCFGPMTVPEIVLESQARGHRPDDHPKLVAGAMRRGMKYHAEKFKASEGRWELQE